MQHHVSAVFILVSLTLSLEEKRGDGACRFTNNKTSEDSEQSNTQVATQQSTLLNNLVNRLRKHDPSSYRCREVKSILIGSTYPQTCEVALFFGLNLV